MKIRLIEDPSVKTEVNDETFTKLMSFPRPLWESDEDPKPPKTRESGNSWTPRTPTGDSGGDTSKTNN